VTRFLAMITSLVVLFGALQAWPGEAGADDAQNVATYQQYLDAVNRGDAAAALAVFTDDAQLSGVRPNCVTACSGRAAIQAQLNIEVSIHLQLQLLSTIQVLSGTVTAQIAHRNDPIRQAGLSRVLTRDTVTFRGDKISSLVVQPDTSDSQTAAFLASLSAPAPVVATPAAMLRPPATGDAGLLSPPKRFRWLALLPSVFVAAAILSVVFTLTGRPRRASRRG
jgi:hypothetical protein